MKVLENRGRVHHGGQDNDVFGSDARNTGNKSKNKLMRLCQTKKFLFSKGHHRLSEETT